MADAIVDKACNIAQMSDDILDGIIDSLESATTLMKNAQVVNDIDLGNNTPQVNVLGKGTQIDSSALSIRLQNAFQKLPADKAARIAAEQNKLKEKQERYNG